MKENMMVLQMELLFKKGEDRYITRRKELESELGKAFNEAILNGSTVAEEAEKILEALCKSAVRSQRIFNIITGQEEFNTIEEETATTDRLKKTFQEAIDRGSDLESEVRKMIEAITVHETDISIMMDCVVDHNLGIDVAMKVLMASI